MKSRRPLCLPVILVLCAGAAGGLALSRMAGTPDHETGLSRSDARALEAARVAAGGRGPGDERGPGTSRARPVGAAAGRGAGGHRDAGAPGVVATLEIPIGGTVDGLPEGVRLEGLAHVTMNVVHDPDFGSPPAVGLAIDLSDVSGVGLSTGARYVTSGEMNLVRPLVPSDVIELMFPIFPDRPDGMLSARSAAASFVLEFDAQTGRFRGRTASTVVKRVDLSD